VRQELEARGAETSGSWGFADVCVVNTCTVTERADADARRFIRRVQRENPGIRVVVVGCSAALQGERYRHMQGVVGVVAGHDPVQVASAAAQGGTLIRLKTRRPPDSRDVEPTGGSLLRRRRGASRGWLKIQDGCDRRCSFCATRLARGRSRSRTVNEVVAEARLMAQSHSELVLTGVHIGQYGMDLSGTPRLSDLLARLLEAVPDVRFRLGSIEATEVEDGVVDLIVGASGRLAPHLHMPLQSGSDSVLRGMRRWHTRETYRRRTLEIAERVAHLGLGADVITGFPGETDEDHELTRKLVEELPYTYLHVFPFSPRKGTVAAELADGVPQRVAGERSRELRSLALEKGRAYRKQRIGDEVQVVPEAAGWVLTGDYLRVRVAHDHHREDRGTHGSPLRGTLRGHEDDLYIDLSPASSVN
jgi:threonylcarbamoyladenosine tRNA methylthiotransferase MtaB